MFEIIKKVNLLQPNGVLRLAILAALSLFFDIQKTIKPQKKTNRVLSGIINVYSNFHFTRHRNL